MTRLELVEAISVATDDELAYAVHGIVALRFQKDVERAEAAARAYRAELTTNRQAMDRIALRILKGE